LITLFHDTLQAGVKALLKKEGLNLEAMSCCIVNQSSLAIDARNPNRLIESMEKLLGTWTLRQEIHTTRTEFEEAQIKASEQEQRINELATIRLDLRPEVCKLLQCNEQHTELLMKHDSVLQGFQSLATELIHKISGEVCD
jgi:hypothetical protein